MTDLSTLSVRDLQRESALALAAWTPTNNELSSLTKQAHHDSQGFYRAVLRRYIDEHGDLPSKVGPGTSITLVEAARGI